MKHTILYKISIVCKLLLVIAGCMAAGAWLQKMSVTHDCAHRPADCVTDTVIVYDTASYVRPMPIRTSSVGFKSVCILPARISAFGADSAAEVREVPDTLRVNAPDVTIDSMTVQLPVVQNIYEGEDYTAYVSGVYPSLDSLFVYPRREIVTIKKPPKRWHIGPTVGYGLTPHGFQPYIGISITYSLISF